MDFKNTYEQKCWEYALGTHERATRMIRTIEEWQDKRGDTTFHCDSLKFWQGKLEEVVAKYPQLKKVM